jgi:hypothetical protein
MNAGRRRIWWSSCPKSPHRANVPRHRAAPETPTILLDRIAAPVHGTPNMGVNLWGASPLYENGR